MEACEKCVHKAVCGKFAATGGHVRSCQHFSEEKHGQWLTDKFGLERSICSVCDACYEGDGGNYCPNCGTPMDGEV